MLAFSYHCSWQFSGESRVAHPRRPKGSQSGQEKRRDESFLVWAKEPLGTDSHRTISKNSNGCRLLIGHKKTFVSLCPISEQHLLSSFRVFVHDGYCLAILVWFVYQGCACNSQGKLSRSAFLNRNEGAFNDSELVSDDYCQLHYENFASDRSQGIINNVNSFYELKGVIDGICN